MNVAVAKALRFVEMDDVVVVDAWMAPPPTQEQCPDGLQCLSVLGTITVKQKKEMVERTLFQMSNLWHNSGIRIHKMCLIFVT